MTEKYTYGYFKKSADFIKNKIGFVPDVGIILGTGCSSLAKCIENPIEIPYQEIPNFLISTNPDHAGKMVAGILEGKKVICMNGRFHFYEGYSFEQLCIPVNVLKILGIGKLILTNAAGAVNNGYRPGDVMIIKDHIKLFGSSPVRGSQIPELGPLFFDVSDMYSAKLREIAKGCASKTKLNVHEGVYMFFPGPQFETPAEIRAARVLGADAVGMSTVTEAITAAHVSLPVLGLSLITNMAAGIGNGKLSGDEVGEMAKKVEIDFCNYLRDLVKSI